MLLSLILAVLLLALAAFSARTALGGKAGTLPMTGRLGVRSEASMRSENAFRVANRVAWPMVAGAAGIAGLCGIFLAAVRPGVATTLIVFVLGLAGAVALLVAAGQLGDRAARTVPKPASKPGGGSCSGCACGGGGCSVLQRTSPAGTATT